MIWKHFQVSLETKSKIKQQGNTVVKQIKHNLSCNPPENVTQTCWHRRNSKSSECFNFSAAETSDYTWPSEN